MKNERYFLIGHPIGHSMSPFIHGRLFAAAGREESYGMRDIPPAVLAAELPPLLAEARGVNVTIPHKQAVIPLLDGLRGRAELYRSVNVIAWEGERRLGYNTDADGFLRALRGADIPLRGRVILLGCGGVGRTFACEAALAGCSLVNAVRQADFPAADALREFVQQLAPGTAYEIADIADSSRLAGEFDLLINATPVGMYPHPEAAPVDGALLRHTAAVFDAVYNPGDTLLLQKARSEGAKALGGMSMLVWQAAAAHAIWYGAEFGGDQIAEITEQADREMRRSFP